MRASGSSMSPIRRARSRSSTEECNSRFNTQGNQGDVIIWGDLIFRSWNSGTPAPRYPDGTIIPTTDPARYTTPGSYCGDWPMYREPAADPLPERGQEGVHIIDIATRRILT